MVKEKFTVPINFIAFQVCWFSCVMGAANDLSWLGPLLVAITVPLQITILTVQRKAETLFVLFSGVLGFFLETTLIAASAYTPIDQSWSMISPPWMTALWFNFAMLVSISLSWLKGKYLLAGILGALFGPVAYWGGEKLGAITVAEVFWHGYLPLALLWALVLPSLIAIHRRLTITGP
jgi:hypothetical protein